MAQYEYKVIPAPNKGRKAPGVKKPEARFAYGLQEVMNEAAADGWEYQRADILPSEERQGLTSSHTVYRSVLVFRRPLAGIAITADTEADTESAAQATPAIAAAAPATATADATELPPRQPEFEPAPEPDPNATATPESPDDLHVEHAEHEDHSVDAEHLKVRDQTTDAHTAQHDHSTHAESATETATEYEGTAQKDEDDTVHRG